MQIRRRSPVSDDHLPASIDPTLKQVYAVRGITTEQQLERSAKALLHYKDMSGIDQAVSILATALAEGKRIIIVGDFDADGATSTALSMLALGMMGSKNHDYLVPNRFDFGYGLSPEIVNVAYEQGAQVIMTVDNGIACFAGVERAKELGITVLVTDHHLAAESLPIADAIVNPNQPNCAFMSKNLAGVGVAFYLMLALRAHLRQINWFSEHNITVPNLAELLDIVALGTVADVVPLDENNRILVHQGLLRIRSDKCRPGIQALIDVAGRDKRKMVASDLGFVIGPRLNAAGRLDDMSMGIECLLTDSDYKAKQIAVELDSLNRERREIEQSMQQEAVATLENLQLSEENMPHGLILYQADFHQGVIGILAGRIKEKYFRPTIAFAHQDDAILKGSARSIPGVHIRDLLEELSTRYPGIIIKFGGHAMAAGLSIELAKLTEFTQRFTQLAEEHLAGQPLAGELISDGEIPASSMTLNFCQILKDAGPWGQGFPEPLFDGEFELVEQRIVGQKHLKMMLRLTTGKLIDGIAFNVDTNIWPNTHCKRVELAYKLDINEFRGRTSLQFLIEGINPL
ncbi:single-stranded-DNA-specific exonuclease RecJ [Paraglaciecola sp. L1A13]|uniref:single-stranded-DNA-specific exonuclease RecJ n=1 Tax=Paraglaciecola sp. L1A13 TaxID=2686359 RepID=UPI00131AE639|nr:single-stranded-DNA-specific exonuclease RecJ [Paraglaciecola sp. L1A13]